MKPEVYRYLSDLVYRESGIVLPPEKAVLLGNRVQKRLRALGLKSESEYLRRIENDKTGDEVSELIDVVSTNVTFFYREPRHFEIYGDILVSRREVGQETKVWCAAASSGEEPYTLAIESVERLGSHPAVKILATDICTTVLNRALSGVYRKKALEKAPSEVRARYFTRVERPDGDAAWQISDQIRQLVLFKRLNLVQFPYPLRGPLDIIFCRNVMIYFDIETRSKIVRAFENLLCPGGFLFLSHSESLLGIDHGLKRYDSSVFRKG